MNSRRILFLHPNYPGQFKTLAIALGIKKNIDAKFLCMTNYGTRIKGINCIKIKGKHGQSAMEKLNLNEIEKMKFRAEAYRLSFTALKNNGWDPDIVIGHTGWGCGVHVKDIWKTSLFIGYSEWWFSLNSSLSKSAAHDPYMAINKDSRIKSLQRNQYIALELCNSDKIVTPTKWQKDLLPKVLKENCLTINDGVDIGYFTTTVVEPSKTPLITYGTRGMEPMRCFRQFIQAIPHIIEKIPNAQIEIAGEDRICYGGLPPSSSQSWGEWAKEYLKNARVDNNITWRGRMDYSIYREWLQRSWCHVYLSQPFVASWSLLEAITTGIPIVANRIPAIEEFCTNVNGICLIENTSTKQILNGVMTTVMNSIGRPYCLRHERTQTIQSLSVEKAMRRWNLVTGLELHTDD